MCTRILWNTNADLIVVGRNEDYVTASPQKAWSGDRIWLRSYDHFIECRPKVALSREAR